MNATNSLVLKDAAPETVCFLGDCVVGAFNNLLFTDPARPDHAILTNTRWRDELRIDAFFAAGRITSEMTRALWDLRCLRQTDDPTEGLAFAPISHQNGEHVYERHHTVRPPERQRTLILGFGTVDALDLDALLTTGAISPSQIAEEVERRCGPLFAGADALRSAGMKRLFILSPVPPSREERDDWPKAEQRWLTRATFNSVYERTCRERGFSFLSTWKTFASNGIRNSQYFLDEVHLNSTGALAVMDALYRHLKEDVVGRAQ